MKTSNARLWGAALCTGAVVYGLTYGALAGIASILGLSAPASPEAALSLPLFQPGQTTLISKAVRVAAADYIPTLHRSDGTRTPAATRLLPGLTTAALASSVSASAATPQGNVLDDTLFTGIVTVDGEQMALLESRQTHEGGYVAVGDDWEGWRVQAISAQEIRLQAGKTSRAMALSEVTSFTSLSAAAPVPTLPTEQPAVEGSVPIDILTRPEDGQAGLVYLRDNALDDYVTPIMRNDVDFDTVELTAAVLDNRSPAFMY